MRQQKAPKIEKGLHHESFAGDMGSPKKEIVWKI